MDIKRALLAFGGLSIGLAGAALYAYLKELNSKEDDSHIYVELKSFLKLIEDHFKLNNDRNKVHEIWERFYKLGEILENKEEHVKMLWVIFERFVDEKQLFEDLDAQPLPVQVNPNQQQLILNTDVIPLYLNR